MQNSHRPRPGDPAAAEGPQAAERRSPSLSEMITMQWQRERSDLDLQSFLLSIYMMRLGTLVERGFDRYCQKRHRINGGDMRLMLALRRSGPPYVRRPTDLFRALLVTSGAVTKKVDRLVEIGFVERLPDPTHSGGFLVHLTRRGLQAVEEAIEHLASHNPLAPAMQRLSPETRQRGTDFALALLSDLELGGEQEADEAEAAPGGRAAKRK